MMGCSVRSQAGQGSSVWWAARWQVGFLVLASASVAKRTIPPKSAVSVIPRLVYPSSLARTASASGVTAPSPKEKPLCARSSTYAMDRTYTEYRPDASLNEWRVASGEWRVRVASGEWRVALAMFVRSAFIRLSCFTNC